MLAPGGRPEDRYRSSLTKEGLDEVHGHFSSLRVLKHSKVQVGLAVRGKSDAGRVYKVRVVLALGLNTAPVLSLTLALLRTRYSQVKQSNGRVRGTYQRAAAASASVISVKSPKYPINSSNVFWSNSWLVPFWFVSFLDILPSCSMKPCFFKSLRLKVPLPGSEDVCRAPLENIMAVSAEMLTWLRAWTAAGTVMFWPSRGRMPWFASESFAKSVDISSIFQTGVLTEERAGTTEVAFDGGVPVFKVYLRGCEAGRQQSRKNCVEFHCGSRNGETYKVKIL
jgi:hypothetical protein